MTLGLMAPLAGLAEQSVTMLLPSDQQNLQHHRDVVTNALSATAKSQLVTSDGKINALNSLIRSHAFDATRTFELQAMGIVLGDVLVADLGFEWVIVSDEKGRDPAIRYPGSTVMLFPLTMISKRIERGEDVDVRQLYDGVAKLAREKVDNERRAQ